MIGFYINSHDLQDEKLNSIIEQMPLGECKVFFNTDIFCPWNHPTFHGQSLGIFQGTLVCTCPFTYKFAKEIFPKKENLYLLWRPEKTKLYRAIDSVEALSQANVLADEKPPICKTFKLWNDFLKEINEK